MSNNGCSEPDEYEGKEDGIANERTTDGIVEHMANTMARALKTSSLEKATCMNASQEFINKIRSTFGNEESVEETVAWLMANENAEQLEDGSWFFTK